MKIPIVFKHNLLTHYFEQLCTRKITNQINTNRYFHTMYIIWERNQSCSKHCLVYFHASSVFILMSKDSFDRTGWRWWECKRSASEHRAEIQLFWTLRHKVKPKSLLAFSPHVTGAAALRPLGRNRTKKYVTPFGLVRGRLDYVPMKLCSLSLSLSF